MKCISNKNIFKKNILLAYQCFNLILHSMYNFVWLSPPPQNKDDVTHKNKSSVLTAILLNWSHSQRYNSNMEKMKNLLIAQSSVIAADKKATVCQLMLIFYCVTKDNKRHFYYLDPHLILIKPKGNNNEFVGHMVKKEPTYSKVLE